MSSTEVVVRTETDAILSDDLTWQSTLERWPTLSDNEKWTSFLSYSLSFHYRFTLNYGSVTSNRVHVVPDDTQVTCENAVRNTLDRLRTNFIPHYNAQLEGEYDEEYGSDAGSDNGDVWREIVRSVQPGAEANYVKFVESLPFCVPIDLGSYRSYPFDNKVVLSWYCPCNRYRFQKFRTMFRLSHSLDWDCRSGRYNSLEALLEHLSDRSSRRFEFNESRLLHMIVNNFIREKHNVT